MRTVFLKNPLSSSPLPGGPPAWQEAPWSPGAQLERLYQVWTAWTTKLTNYANVPSIIFQSSIHFYFKLPILMKTGKYSPGTVGYIPLVLQKCPVLPAIHPGLQVCNELPPPMAGGVLTPTPQLRPLTAGRSPLSC